MITYVNTVFVSNNDTATLASGISSINKGQFIVYDVDTNVYDITSTTKRFKIGMGTGKTVKDHKGVSHPLIKWSNIINVADIKKLSTTSYPGADTEDAVYIDLSGATDVIGQNKVLSQEGKRIIVRLTFKDMIGFRYRKWTESYEYVTKDGETAASIATGLANIINKEWKRARVVATVGEMNSTSTSADATVGDSYYHADANWNDAANASSSNNTLRIEALPYDDDDAVETLNWAEKVRFNAHIYYTDPTAEGWAALNKNFPTGAVITKVPGFRYTASAKLVRDREAQGLGYEGILNRGEGTWPIIKPALETDLSKHYNSITLEFENMYRAADDIFRKTKQSVEIYMTAAVATLIGKLDDVIGTAAVDRSTIDNTTEKGNIA